MLLFYLRHGDPIYDPDSLTPLGERQAEALAHRLSIYGFDRIYCSTSRRAQQTAEPTCQMLNKSMELLDWCNEGYAHSELSLLTDKGNRMWCFQHRATVELMASDEVRRLDKQWHTHPAFPESFGKGIARISKHCDEFLLSLGYRHDGERNGYVAESPNDRRIALFAHQGFGMAFLSCVLDIPYPQMTTRFDLQHTGMSVIHFENRKGFVIPKLLQLSGDGHLYRDGLPLKYNNEICI